MIWEYLVQMVVLALAGAFFWAFTRPIRCRVREKRGYRPGSGREGALLLFFMFLTALLALTLTPGGFWSQLLASRRLPPLPEPFQGGINLVPFQVTWTQYKYFASRGIWSFLLVNFLGNLLMFVPVGFFSGLLAERPRWWKSTLASLALSFFIEVFQLFVSRGTDVDDLILNTLGGLMGYGCFLLVRKWDPGLISRCKKR